MRGLNYMIEPKASKSKKDMNDDQELVKPGFLDKKKKEEFNEEEIKIYNEYLKKEKEIQERKDKIRSQNLTKLNNHKMEIENLKAELDSKFLKIYKKKLYYDYRICEQSLYILALQRTMESRQEIKRKAQEISAKYNSAKEEEEKALNHMEIFEKAVNRFLLKYSEIEKFYYDKNKNNKMLEHNEKILLDNYDLNTADKEFLKQIRSDPFYYFEYEKLKQSKRYGTKNYKEIKNAPKSTINEDNVQLINQKHYVRTFNFNLLVRLQERANEITLNSFNRQTFSFTRSQESLGKRAFTTR